MHTHVLSMPGRVLMAMLVQVLAFPTLAHAQECKWSWKAFWQRPFALDTCCTPKALCKLNLLTWRKCWPRGDEQDFASANASTQTSEPGASELEEALAAGLKGDVSPLVGLITSGSEQAKEKAAFALMHLDKENTDLAAKIVAADAIEPLAALLKSGTVLAQAGAAWVLATLATGLESNTHNTANQIKIAAAGAITPLVTMLTSGNEPGQAGAAAALAGLAEKNLENQVAIAAAGAIEPLVSLLATEEALKAEDPQVPLSQARVMAALALASLAFENPDNQQQIAAAGAIEPLVALLNSGSAQAKGAAEEALHSMNT